MSGTFPLSKIVITYVVWFREKKV